MIDIYVEINIHIGKFDIKDNILGNFNISIKASCVVCIAVGSPNLLWCFYDEATID